MPAQRRGAPADAAETHAAGPRVLKKYPNRRLYDTDTSTYITLADVKQLVMDNESFVVRDAKTNEDLTRSILLQIILEEESGGVPMFSTPMLPQIIRFYGHSAQGVMGAMLEKNLQNPLQGMMGNYAEQSKNMFEKMQEQVQKNTEQMLGAFGIKK